MGYPDFVAQLRVGAPAFVVHASGAMHEIRDVSANAYNTFMPKYSTWGWAAQLAGEYRWKWSGLVGPIGGEMYGKAMLSATATQGALSYLGIPYMSIDYVSSSTGTIQRSSGQALMGSYEHLGTPVFKTSITGAAFQAYMGSAPEFLGFGNVAFGFNTQVRGQRVVGNAEYWAGEGWAFGLEGGWTWSGQRPIPRRTRPAGSRQFPERPHLYAEGLLMRLETCGVSATSRILSQFVEVETIDRSALQS